MNHDYASDHGAIVSTVVISHVFLTLSNDEGNRHRRYYTSYLTFFLCENEKDIFGFIILQN